MGMADFILAGEGDLCLLIIVQHMLRNGRTGHTWHLVVDHIMLVMKMKSSSPVNRLVGLYRGFMCMYKKTKTKKQKKKKWLVTAGSLQRLEKAGCKWLSSKKKKKKRKKKEKKFVLLSVTLLTISLYGINVLNDYMRFFTGLYCESLI